MRHPSAHTVKMTSKLSVRLLDVDVRAVEPTRWRWAVSEENFELLHGYATSRETAQFEGDSALFILLSFVPAP